MSAQQPLITLTYDVRDHVAYVTFDRPEQLNSINEARLSDLAEVAERLEKDQTLRAVSITGNGRAFCVGLDLDLLRRAIEDTLYFEHVVRRLNDFILRLEKLPIPVVASVNGFARAGGFEIALGCDLMLIAEDAKIGDNHSHVGVMPGGGSTKRLPMRVGMQRAKELIYTARWLSGTEAAEIGLALRAVPGEALAEETENLLNQLRDKPRETLAAIKRTMNASASLSVADGVEMEIAQFLNYMGNQSAPRDGFWASLGEEPPARQRLPATAAQ